MYSCRERSSRSPYFFTHSIINKFVIKFSILSKPPVASCISVCF